MRTHAESILVAMRTLIAALSCAQLLLAQTSEPETKYAPDGELAAQLARLSTSLCLHDYDLSSRILNSIDDSRRFGSDDLWLLLESAIGNHPNGISSTCLDIALRNSKSGSSIGYLIRTLDRTRSKELSLIQACANNKIDIIKTLISDGIGPNCRFRPRQYGEPSDVLSPLTTAIIAKAPMAALYLLEHGADPNARGYSRHPLMLAVKTMQYDTCQILIQHGAIGDMSSIADAYDLIWASTQGYAGEENGGYRLHPNSATSTYALCSMISFVFS